MPALLSRVDHRRFRGAGGLAVLGLVFLSTSSGRAQAKPDPAADMLLGAARKSLQDRNYPGAAGQFREFLARHPKHEQISSARYGLAQSLLEGPDKDYAGAGEQLKLLVGNTRMTEHAYVLYYAGMVRRGLGIKELSQAKPQDVEPRRAAAAKYFGEAVGFFEAAGKAFRAKAKNPAANVATLPTEWEWAGRCRCDQAEMHLRLGKQKEAQALAAPFVKDPVLIKSRYRGLGLYYHGFASFLLGDYHAAGRSLNMLTPFGSSVYATHARYLLARTHHLQDELAEAAGHYEGVLADYEKFKKEAAEALRQPDRFKNDPDEKAQLEALVRDPPPDHLACAAFYSGILHYEAGRFADALARFTAFPQQYQNCGLQAEVQLRQGLCQVQLRQYAQAVGLLQPLADKEPRLADQALWWIGKSQVGAADPNNAQAYAQALKTALETLRRAADKAQEKAQADPEATVRRGGILLEIGDTQQLARQFKEAATTYGTILEGKLLPRREAEVLERQVTAYHLAGDYAASDKVCAAFRQKFPRGPLLPAVIFRSAENALFQAQGAKKLADVKERARETARLNEEAAKRYQEVIDHYPEFAYVSQARYARGLLHHRAGEFDKAKEVLEKIAASERNGALALTPYVLADCLMRLAPAKADDALAAGKLQEELQAAVELLDGFISAQPNSPQTPDALLKLGLCHQRLAVLFAKPEERAKELGNSRAAYDRLVNQFPQHALQPQGVYERARCQGLMGDKQGAINELRRFTDALKTATIAPMGLLQLSLLLREQNKAEEAAKVLEECRKQHEETLLKDPGRAGWVAQIQLHQGLALREAGKFAAAGDLLAALIKQFPDRPEGIEAALRKGQCLKDEALVKVDAARKRLGQPNLKPQELDEARKRLMEEMKGLQAAVNYLAEQADRLKEKQPASEVRARLLYEAAWGYREVAGPEIEAARDRRRSEKLKEAVARGANKQPAAVVAPSEVTLVEIKVQPSEEKARARYEELIEAFADMPLANEARLELAELHAQRGAFGPAIKLLDEALDKEPPAELTEKVRMLLGTCSAARKEFKAALAQFDAVAQNAMSPFLAQAHYRAGECLLALQDYPKAAARLIVFRDQQPFQNLPGLSDRALLALGRVYAAQKQWDLSRQAYEVLAGRFGNSPWIHEARFGMGLAWENQKQFDNAVNVYSQVTAATAAEPAARAQYHIGVCRLEQGRHAEAATAFLVVPFTYDYPEWSAAALCQAARACLEDKTDPRPVRARRLLRRVLKDHPQSKWAQVAQERLKALGEG
jgi:TolA-binding protein